MDSKEILIRLASLPLSAAQNLPALSAEQLNAHPAGHPNSIAWLLWHSAREIDVQLAQLNGQHQLWEEFSERFDLGEIGMDLGYGHSAEQAHLIIVDDQQLLLDYLEATLSALSTYAGTLSEAELDDIVDRSWEPPVTRGVRLISILDDAIQHVGQAAYAAGTLA
ncbi:DinB family protein [Glutamicibacter arilaitensis]|uniref:mycothiol transferase n=1 Tax=Glutamicibacter arilaitensis TaxID=256701 RepID=UPI00384A6825